MSDIHDIKARAILQTARWAPLRIGPDGSWGMLEMDARNDISQALQEASDKEQDKIKEIIKTCT